MRSFRFGRGPAKPLDAAALASCASGYPSLLLHQAVYALVAFVLGSRAWNRTCRSLDRRARSLDPRILLLTAAVTFWVAGFDVLYSCQDYDYDRDAGLHSVPRYFGIAGALWVARLFHVIMLCLLVALVIAFGLGKLAIAGVVSVAVLLFYEHSLVSSEDLSKLNAAFFTMNGVISVLFFFFVAGDLLFRL